MKPGANALGISRPAIALKLLAHGPLSAAEFRAITGWSDWHTSQTLAALHTEGALRVRFSDGARRWMLADSVNAKQVAACA